MSTNVHTDVPGRTTTDGPLIDQPQSRAKDRRLIVRVLRSPLFLVIFTWVLMAFLLAFEVSGK